MQSEDPRTAWLSAPSRDRGSEPPEPHPRPWTWGVGYHDGWFFQFFDANGDKILGDSIRDPDDAALLLKTINRDD